jgi:mycothiol synthase
MAAVLMWRPHLDNLPSITPLPPGYELREFGAGDSELELAQTLTESFGEPWDEARVRRSLTEAQDVKAVFIVIWQGQIVATTSSQVAENKRPGAGLVHWVGTRPDHRGRGLAAALLERVLQDFIQRSYPDAALETHDFRHAAIRVYLRFGFLPVYTFRGEDQSAIWSAVFQALGRAG